MDLCLSKAHSYEVKLKQSRQGFELKSLITFYLDVSKVFSFVIDFLIQRLFHEQSLTMTSVY